MAKKRAKKQTLPPGSPFNLHARGLLRARVGGKDRYFGGIERHDEAVKELRQLRAVADLGEDPDAHHGRNAVTVGSLFGQWLEWQDQRVDAGEIEPGTCDDYCYEATIVLAELGRPRKVATLREADFTEMRTTLGKRFESTTVKRFVSTCKAAFHWAWESRVIDSPVRFGPGFKPPGKRQRRKQRAKRPPKIMPAEAIRAILDDRDRFTADCALLAVNSGFTAKDISELHRDVPDWEQGVLDYSRPKTGVPRLVTLWPESIEALRRLADQSPKPNNPDDDWRLVLNPNGDPVRKKRSNVLSYRTRQALQRAGMYEPGRSFSALRHVTKTIGGKAKDPDALRYLMGHVESGVGEDYSHGIDVERVRAVTDAVRSWLWKG